jgi:sporulation-control protein spo0M
MGFMDKLKAAAHAVTGGAAKVTIEYQPQVAFAGDSIQVKITATSTGAEVKSKGIFVDIRGLEVIQLDKHAANSQTDVHHSKATFEQSFQIAPEFVLPPKETKQFSGTLTVPPSLQPSYKGNHAEHRWEIQGRVEAFGNDPDSGWQPLRIGLKG